MSTHPPNQPLDIEIAAFLSTRWTKSGASLLIILKPALVTILQTNDDL